MRGVPERLAAAELEVGGGEVERRRLRAAQMPTSNETRVRVEGFWKIIPSVRPGRRWCSSRRRCALLRLVGEVERRQELVAAPVGDASEVAPFQARPQPCGIGCYWLGPERLFEAGLGEQVA